MSVELLGGEQTLAYCANPGSFNGCLEAGNRCLLWDSGVAARKRRYTWRAIRLGDVWVGMDTHLANELVHKALCAGALRSLAGYRLIEREPRNAKGGRLDFRLEDGCRECFVEVKSATVVEGVSARFPDSVSPRAVAHVKELTKLAKAGRRAVLVFLIQRGDVERLEINRAGDPAFARAVKRGVRAGVEFLAVKHSVTTRGFGEPNEVPVLI